MNNQELELRIKEILRINNMFDMILAAKAFESEYKKSEFYKATKMSLAEVIKNGKMWYTINLDDIYYKIQSMIDELDFSKLTSLLGQLGDVFGQENSDMMEIIKEFKTIVK